MALVDEARITVTYEVVSTSGTIRRLTKVHEVTGELTSRLVAEADDGVATDVTALRASIDAGPTPMANGCPDCTVGTCCRRYSCQPISRCGPY